MSGRVGFGVAGLLVVLASCGARTEVDRETAYLAAAGAGGGANEPGHSAAGDVGTGASGGTSPVAPLAREIGTVSGNQLLLWTSYSSPGIPPTVRRVRLSRGETDLQTTLVGGNCDSRWLAVLHEVADFGTFLEWVDRSTGRTFDAGRLSTNPSRSFVGCIAAQADTPQGTVPEVWVYGGGEQPLQAFYGTEGPETSRQLTPFWTEVLLTKTAVAFDDGSQPFWLELKTLEARPMTGAPPGARLVDVDSSRFGRPVEPVALLQNEDTKDCVAITQSGVVTTLGPCVGWLVRETGGNAFAAAREPAYCRRACTIHVDVTERASGTTFNVSLPPRNHFKYLNGAFAANTGGLRNLADGSPITAFPPGAQGRMAGESPDRVWLGIVAPAGNGYLLRVTEQRADSATPIGEWPVGSLDALHDDFGPFGHVLANSNGGTGTLYHRSGTQLALLPRDTYRNHGRLYAAADGRALQLTEAGALLVAVDGRTLAVSTGPGGTSVSWDPHGALEVGCSGDVRLVRYWDTTALRVAFESRWNSPCTQGVETAFVYPLAVVP